MKFATKPTQHYPPRLMHVATLPWDIKNSNFLQIFSRCAKNANKLHFKCTDFNSSMCITVYAGCIYVFFIKIVSSSLNAVIVDKHCSDVCCDEFPVPQTDCKSKQVKEHSDRKFYLQSVWKKTCYLRHLKYQHLWINNKVRRAKMQFVCIFIYLLNICRKFDF